MFLDNISSHSSLVDKKKSFETMPRQSSSQQNLFNKLTPPKDLVFTYPQISGESESEANYLQSTAETLVPTSSQQSFSVSSNYTDESDSGDTSTKCSPLLQGDTDARCSPPSQGDTSTRCSPPSQGDTSTRCSPPSPGDTSTRRSKVDKMFQRQHQNKCNLYTNAVTLHVPTSDTTDKPKGAVAQRISRRRISFHSLSKFAVSE